MKQKHWITHTYNEHLAGKKSEVRFRRYPNDRLALTLLTEDGAPAATPSVNVPELAEIEGLEKIDQLLKTSHVLLKAYSENLGIARDLEESGITKTIGKFTLPPHDATIVIARLLVTPVTEEEN